MFGRAQTQAWINRFSRNPRVYAFLDRHHGKFRAAVHYIEFGGLYLLLYWLYDAAFLRARLEFLPIPTVVIALICAVAALCDELHQLRSGTRCFRRIDFLYSCLGISLAAAIVYFQAFFRHLA
jgi:hypothetical protein